MKTNDITILLLLILTGLICYFMWFKHSVENDSQHELDKLHQHIEQQETIAKKLNLQVDSLLTINENLVALNDSLYKEKAVIKIKYREVYKHIDYASNTELDSIIRKNW